MKHALFLSAGFLALAACNGSGEDVGAGAQQHLEDATVAPTECATERREGSRAHQGMAHNAGLKNY